MDSYFDATSHTDITQLCDLSNYFIWLRPAVSPGCELIYDQEYLAS